MTTEHSDTIKTPFSEIGSSNFEEFANSKTAIFVDKTSFIEAAIRGKKVLLITRPRRWGKTLNMSMLEYFFSIPVKADGSIDETEQKHRSKIFSIMSVGEHIGVIQQYLAKYPTIFISFKDIKGSSYDKIESAVRNLIYKLYASHKYLLVSNKLDYINKALFKKFITKKFDLSELKDSILYLSEMLHTHFGKNVIVLIDEYDTPMNDWYANKLASGEEIDSKHDEHLQEVLELFIGLFGAALKDNKYLEKGVVTGILRIAKASLFSGLNNFTEDSILDDNYSKYFGFTEEEVGNLLHKSGNDHDSNTVVQMKSWYNGYNIGGITIYNPWSIMNWLDSQGRFKAYWVGTASTALIENALMLDKYQEEIQSLIEGKTVDMIADPKMIFSEITSSSNALYNLLLFSGYLTVESAEQGKGGTYNCLVRIPNKEILEIFEISAVQWLSSKFKIEVNEYNDFANDLIAGNVELFISKLQNYLEISSSCHSTGPNEVFYNGLMIGLIVSVSNKYFVESEKETGGGRADLTLIPKSTAKHDIAFILEYKVATKTEDLVSTANIALEQIKNKNYISKIKTHDNVHRIISIGLAFCGKDVEVAYLELALKS